MTEAQTPPIRIQRDNDSLHCAREISRVALKFEPEGDTPMAEDEVSYVCPVTGNLVRAHFEIPAQIDGMSAIAESTSFVCKSCFEEHIWNGVDSITVKR